MPVRAHSHSAPKNRFTLSSGSAAAGVDLAAFQALLASSRTRNQVGSEAYFKYPVRSGSCSTCEGSTADSTVKCRLRETEPITSVARRLVDSVVRSTSLSPMSSEANRAVPPPSLAEQRSIKELEQFSTIVCASP